MSNIFTGTISGINTIQNSIHNTVKNIQTPISHHLESTVVKNALNTYNFNDEVQMKKVYDDYNDFLTEEMRKTETKIAEEKSDINQLVKLEDLLCEKSSIFSSLMKELHDQIEENIILHPDNEIHEKIEKKLYDVIMSLKDFNAKLNFLEKDIKDTIHQNVISVNAIIDGIQEINVELAKISSTNHPTQIKLLLNARELLVAQLNQIIEVKVVKTDSDYKIFLHDEIALIDNNKKQHLGVITSESDANYISIGYKDNNSNNPQLQKIEHMISTGALHSLLRFRREEMHNTRNKIGQLTINFAHNINSYRMLGYDKYGEIGTQFLKVSRPEVIVQSSHKKSILKSALWDDVNHVKDSDYQVFFKDHQWNVRRLSDNTTIQPTNLDQRNELSFTSLHFDGMIFNVDGTGQEGDSYIIKPYSQLLNTLELKIDKKSPIESFSGTNTPETKINHDFRVYRFNQDFLIDNDETFDDSYQNFTKDIIYKRRFIEDGIPFKRKLLTVLEDKKMSISNNPEKDYQDMNFQQKCYMANSQVLKTAEKILHEIIDAYS